MGFFAKCTGVAVGALLATSLAVPASATVITFDPDSYAAGTVLNTVSPLLTLTALGVSVTSSNVYSREAPAFASTGTRVFGYDGSFDPQWEEDLEDLRVDFASPTNFVSIDVIGNDSSDFGRLRAFDAGNVLLATVNSGLLGSGDIQTLSVLRGSADIAYILVSGDELNDVHIDQLQFDGVPEPSTVLLLGSGVVA